LVILTNGVKVLCPTQHKIGHFKDALPSQSLGFVVKTKSNTRKTNMRDASITKYTIIQNKHKKLKPGFDAYYAWPGNEVSLFLRKSMSK